ncbi:MAG: hypothetical protein ACOCX9_09140 [Spirochaetota bacterium]
MISAQTIHNIAVEMERKGIDFYQQLKDGSNDAIIDDIIGDEKEHIQIFHDLFNETTGVHKGESYPHFYMDEDMLIEAYANTEIFGSTDPNKVQGKSSFDVAVMMEKESILFYSQLQDMFGDDPGYKKEIEILDKLKKEEARHLKKFTELRNRMGDV